MRTLVFIALGAGSALLSGSWAQVLQVAGVPVDLVLLVFVCLGLIDRSVAPVVFAACTGLFVDIAYSTVIGCSALADTVTAALIFFMAQRADRINLLMVVGAGGAAYLIKNLIIALILYAKGISGLHVGPLMLRYVLPGALLSAALIIPAYALLLRLMRCRFMRARRVIVDEY